MYGLVDVPPCGSKHLHIHFSYRVYTLLTLKYGVNLLNAPTSSVLLKKFACDFDSDWQRANTFFHCVTLTRILFPQIISYSGTKVSVLVVMERKRASVLHVYQLTFLLHTSRSTE